MRREGSTPRTIQFGAARTPGERSRLRFSKSPVWGLREHHHSSSRVHVEIPRSVWVERVLPQTEFGKIHLIELPVIPLEAVAGCTKAFDALKEAQEHHKNGFYNAAVFNCRQ